jgi:hypothetical protein
MIVAQLPRHRREAELEECVSLVEARESTLRGRVWVKKASGRLGVLDCKTLQIRDSGIFLDNQASGCESFSGLSEAKS